VVVANVADRIGVEWGVAVRRYPDQEDSPTAVRVRVSPLFRVGSVRVCPFVQWRDLRRTVSFHFRVDRGELREMDVIGGLAGGGALGSVHGIELGWQASTGVMFRDWDSHGRRTLVDSTTVVPTVRVEEVHWVRQYYHLTAEGGISARIGGVGLMAGLGTTPHAQRDLYGYVSLGFRVAGRP
jgi:hypothetical protein